MGLLSMLRSSGVLILSLFTPSQLLRDTLNLHCSSTPFIDFHDGALQQHSFLCHLKPLWLAGPKAPDDRLDLAAQHALVRAGKSGVSQVGRAAGENLFVGRLHV